MIFLKIYLYKFYTNNLNFQHFLYFLINFTRKVDVNKYLEINDLSISYFKHPVLENVNLNLYAGQRIGIIGKNGCGKTTLVETIMGVNNPNVFGSLKYFLNIENDIKAVFQEYEYERTLSLKQIYKMYASINKSQVRSDLNKMFCEYGLDGLEHKKYHKLSGGQKQKFKLLMCLELEPKLLILDEVTTSLDFLWRQEILKIIKCYLTQHPECALILVSHDYHELKTLTDKQYLIDNKNLDEIYDLNTYFNEYLTNTN